MKVMKEKSEDCPEKPHCLQVSLFLLWGHTMLVKLIGIYLRVCRNISNHPNQLENTQDYVEF